MNQPIAMFNGRHGDTIERGWIQWMTDNGGQIAVQAILLAPLKKYLHRVMTSWRFVDKEIIYISSQMTHDQRIRRNSNTLIFIVMNNIIRQFGCPPPRSISRNDLLDIGSLLKPRWVEQGQQAGEAFLYKSCDLSTPAD